MAASLGQVEDAMARDPGVSPVLLMRLASTEPRLWPLVRDNPACPPDLRLWIDVQMSQGAEFGLPGGRPQPAGAAGPPEGKPTRQMWTGGEVPLVEPAVAFPNDSPDMADLGPAQSPSTPSPGMPWSSPSRPAAAPSSPTSTPTYAASAAGPGRGGRRRVALVALVAAGVTLAIAAGLAVALLDFGGDPAEPTVVAAEGTAGTAEPSAGNVPGTASEPTAAARIPPCPTPPDLEPAAVDSDPAGMTVSLEMQASCSGGQYVDDGAYTITLERPGGQVVASTDFDFSADPVWVPPPDAAVQGAAVRAHFPVGTFWEVPSDLQDDVVAGSVVARTATSGAAASSGRPPPEEAGVGDVVEVDGAVAGRTDQVEKASLAALRTQARRDRPDVLFSMEGRWVPQLSSKRLKTYDEVDDLKYNEYREIWGQHVDLRLRFPQARLLWSGDWASFDDDDYWVTVAGATFEGAQGAVRWCDKNGFPGSQCYAKEILQFGSPEGTTVLRD